MLFSALVSGLIVRGNAGQHEMALLGTFGVPTTGFLRREQDFHTPKRRLHTDRTDFGEGFNGI
jgi:hypothetical protein